MFAPEQCLSVCELRCIDDKHPWFSAEPVETNTIDAPLLPTIDPRVNL